MSNSARGSHGIVRGLRVVSTQDQRLAIGAVAKVAERAVLSARTSKLPARVRSAGERSRCYPQLLLSLDRRAACRGCRNAPVPQSSPLTSKRLSGRHFVPRPRRRHQYSRCEKPSSFEVPEAFRSSVALLCGAASGVEARVEAALLMVCGGLSVGVQVAVRGLARTTTIAS